jgi:hypothetical protein
MAHINQDILKQIRVSKRERYEGPKPQLRVSLATKIKNNFEHTKNIVDYYMENTWFNNGTVLQGNRDLYLLYDAYNNRIPESYFHYITNPYNSSRKEYTNFPARIRPYPIIRTNIDLLQGEFEKRPFNYTVVVHNEDAFMRMEEEIYQSVLESLSQSFINHLNEMGIDTGVDSKQPEPPAEIRAKKKSNYKDQRAIMGQAAIEKAYDDCEVDMVWSQMFKDYMIAGEAYSYKDVVHGKLVYERVSPLDIDYDKAPDTRFVEDSDFVVRRKYMTAADVISHFYDEMTDGEIDEIDEKTASLPFTSNHFDSFFSSSLSNEEDLKRAKIPVYHIVFKYYSPLCFVSYEDRFGNESEMEVPETYEARPGEKITKIWVPEIWQAYRVDLPYTDKEESLYYKIGPVVHQRSAMTDFSVCKGNYNGIRFSDTHSQNISLVEMGLPYEIFNRILHWKMEFTIAKSKGKIALLDQNAIPREGDWDEEKFFYYAEATGFGLLNRNQIGVDKNFNQYTVLDMGLYEHIKNLIELMEYTKREWDNLVGISPPRKGQTSPSETATGIQTARYQSSVISERIFTSFDELRKRDLNGLMDLSKFSDITGQAAIHHMSEMKSIYTEMNPVDYANSEFGVYVSHSGKDLEQLNQLKAMVPQIASQNTSPQQLIQIIQAQNISMLKDTLATMEEKEIKLAQQQSESEQALEQRKMEIQKEYEAIKYRFEDALQSSKYDREERLAHIKGQYDLADTDAPGDELNPLDAQKSALEATKVQSERELKKEELDVKRQEIKSKERTTKYAADKSLQVAKENKTQAELKRSENKGGKN